MASNRTKIIFHSSLGLFTLFLFIMGIYGAKTHYSHEKPKISKINLNEPATKANLEIQKDSSEAPIKIGRGKTSYYGNIRVHGRFFTSIPSSKKEERALTMNPLELAEFTAIAVCLQPKVSWGDDFDDTKIIVSLETHCEGNLTIYTALKVMKPPK